MAKKTAKKTTKKAAKKPAKNSAKMAGLSIYGRPSAEVFGRTVHGARKKQLSDFQKKLSAYADGVRSSKVLEQ